MACFFYCFSGWKTLILFYFVYVTILGDLSFGPMELSTHDLWAFKHVGHLGTNFGLLCLARKYTFLRVKFKSCYWMNGKESSVSFQLLLTFDYGWYTEWSGILSDEWRGSCVVYNSMRIAVEEEHVTAAQGSDIEFWSCVFHKRIHLGGLGMEI